MHQFMENLGTVFFQKFECLLMNNRELKFKWSKNFSEESRGAMKKLSPNQQQSIKISGWD